MKYIVWLCVYQFTITLSSGQSPEDSLRQLLNKARVGADVKSIQQFSSQLAWLHFKSNRYDIALKYYKESLNAIAPDTDLRLQGSIMTSLGIIYGSVGKFDSCVNYYREALKKFTLAHDTANALVAESNLSIVFKNIGLYEESIESALHVISSLKPSDNSGIRGTCYNTMGSVHMYNNDFGKAREYYHLAGKDFKLSNRIADVARTSNNIGELFILLHQYDSATHYLNLSADIKRELNDIKGLSRTLNNIGKVMMLEGHLDMAERQFSDALAIQKDMADPVGMIEVLNNFGELNIKKQQLDLALRNLHDSEIMIHRVGAPEYLRRNLELQVRLDRDRRDFATGMMHLDQLSAIRDSLMNQEKDRSMQAMQIRYETLKKEQQIAILEQQEEMNRSRIRNNQILIGTLIIGLILVATVGLLAYANFRNARAARERFELLLADTRHRIKNNLQTLASIFHLQAKYYTDNNMILEARSSESRVHAMSLLHQKFYSASPGHTIELRKYVEDLVNQLIDIYSFRTKNLCPTIGVDDIQLDINKALPLSLIIQELVSNAFKYAFGNESNPKLEVTIRQSNGELETIVADNGIGMKIEKTRSSQGFSLVEDFVAQLDGNLQVKTEKGTTFIIRFPINPLWKRHSY